MTTAQVGLAGALEAVGAFTPEWRAAFDAAPRRLFVPDTIWVEDEDEGGWRPLSRAVDPDGWQEAVDRDGYVVTQVDDGHPATPGRGEYSTSSASQPSLVLRMLRMLRVEPGMRVLEIGTGTGYNAALLAARLGAGNVTTIEVDPALADRARQVLRDAGFPVQVITGDGACGFLLGAPYDRVIATAAVQRIPAAWVEQTRPGGMILAPFGSAYHNDALVRLTVGADGSASGRFVGRAAFMWLRRDRVLLGGLGDYVHDDDVPDVSATDLDPREMFGRADADFAVAAQVPAVSWHRFDGPPESGEFTVWLLHTGAGGRSWASVDYEPGAGTYRVEQYGPWRLWTEVETAYRRWLQHGRPGIIRYGLTVAADGGQRIWLDSPDGPSWSVPPG